MVSGRHKSRSLRRVDVKIPSGRQTTKYRVRKPSKHSCTNCKAVLPGVQSKIVSKISRTAKSKRRPSRPYAGVLCSKCTRLKIISRQK